MWLPGLSTLFELICSCKVSVVGMDIVFARAQCVVCFRIERFRTSYCGFAVGSLISIGRVLQWYRPGEYDTIRVPPEKYCAR